MSFSNKFSKRFHDHRARKNAEKSKNRHHSTRAEYLLNEETPFDVTEAFRNLKASLSVSVPKKQGGIAIMTTSAYPEDGKTTVTVNLALMFALSNAKVVLLDADIRKGRIAKYFKRKPAPGLSDYLSGQANLDKVIHKSQINENLSYITCGTHSPRPYELLESEEMAALMEELRKRYDYIIIDTPPVLLISDALALTPITDGVALVCRHQVSFVSDIARALNTLKFAKANVLGVIVNDYKAPKSGKFYGGYKKYYYYSSYSYGSTNPEDKDDGSEILLELEDDEPTPAPTPAPAVAPKKEEKPVETIAEKSVEKPVTKQEEKSVETPAPVEEKQEVAEEKKEEITETVTVEDVAKEVPETVEGAEEDKANKLADLRNKYSR